MILRHPVHCPVRKLAPSESGCEHCRCLPPSPGALPGPISLCRAAGGEKRHGILLPDRIRVVHLAEEFRRIANCDSNAAAPLPDGIAALPDSRQMER